MKSISQAYILIVIPVILFISCNKPDDKDKPEEQLASYTNVISERSIIPGLSDFGYFKHFLVDSNIYMVSSSIMLHELKLAVIDLDAELKRLKTFYTSNYSLSVGAVYDPDRDYFYINGCMDYDTDFYDSDPFFLVIDREGNIIYEKTFLWPGGDDGLQTVIWTSGHDPVLLAYVRDGSIGIFAQQKYSMIFLDNNFDSVSSFIVPFDSCSINYIDIPDNEIIRIIASITDSAVYSTQYTHKIYAELDFEGKILRMENLSPEMNDHIYYENSVPMNYYNWYAFNNKAIALQKYSESGSLLGSSSIELLPVQYPLYDFALTFGKDKFSSQNILYGDFYDYTMPQPPVFHANYLIKFNDNGNEQYRVVFDVDLAGFMRNGPLINVIEEDLYVFLYLFQTNEGAENFYFSKVKVE